MPTSGLYSIIALLCFADVDMHLCSKQVNRHGRNALQDHAVSHLSIDDIKTYIIGLLYRLQCRLFQGPDLNISPS